MCCNSSIITQILYLFTPSSNSSSDSLNFLLCVFIWIFKKYPPSLWMRKEKVPLCPSFPFVLLIVLFPVYDIRWWWERQIETNSETDFSFVLFSFTSHEQNRSPPRSQGLLSLSFLLLSTFFFTYKWNGPSMLNCYQICFYLTLYCNKRIKIVNAIAESPHTLFAKYRSTVPVKWERTRDQYPVSSYGRVIFLKLVKGGLILTGIDKK